MRIRSIRAALYKGARVLGDVQAVESAARTASPKPIAKRIIRRQAGRIAGGILRWITK